MFTLTVSNAWAFPSGTGANWWRQAGELQRLTSLSSHMSEQAFPPPRSLRHTHTHTGGRQVKVCGVFSTLPSDCVSHFIKKFADRVNRLSTAVCSKTVYSTWQNPTEILEFDYKNMHRNYGIWIHTSLKKCQLKFLKWLLIQGRQMNPLCYRLVSICYLFVCTGLCCFLLAFCSCSVPASHCRSCFCCGAWALGFLGFSSCGTWAQ